MFVLLKNIISGEIEVNLEFIDICAGIGGFRSGLEKAQAVNSDSQLYKQAGNAVTVNVAYYLGELLNE